MWNKFKKAFTRALSGGLLIAIIAMLGGCKSSAELHEEQQTIRCSVRWADFEHKVVVTRHRQHQRVDCFVKIGGKWYPEDAVKIGD